MRAETDLLAKIEQLQSELNEARQIIEAIQNGEVDAIAVNANGLPEVYTIQSGDYAYRVLIEQFGEGALNLTEEGLIVYTNTAFCEMIGLRYDDVIGTNILDHIHRDSSDLFKGLFLNAQRGKTKGEVNLQAGNKLVPVYVSLTSLNPKMATIGVIVTDLSDKKLTESILAAKNDELIEKNRELERSNTELASFSYIASHDLQEPLRKIQTFSNQILNKESRSFSDDAMNYFQRIINASVHMQNLISALLDYSRTNTSSIVLEHTDLNNLLKDVKRDLSEVIEKNDVVFKSGNLPVLKVVPLQINQLFSNIISNAIKYKKKGVPVTIAINAKVVTGPFDITETEGQRYWKIDFVDDGIGFEQKHALKIFELFQRLHGKSEYEGTGIGLAICKKIVQNHKGYIVAKGEVNVGACFSIYLPVNS